jgi:hypothetical protein
MSERRNAYRVLVKKSVVRLTGRSGLKLDGDINIDLKEIRWERLV